MPFPKMSCSIVCLLLLSFCSDVGRSNNPNPGMSKGTLEWQILVSETQCSIDKPRQMLIKSEEEFDKIWKESQSGIEMGPAKPKVDFSKQWVIAGFLGWVKSSGYKLEIKSVETGSAATVITLLQKRPGPGCMNAQVIEFPYFFASINHFSPETVQFKTVTEDVKCE